MIYGLIGFLIGCIIIFILLNPKRIKIIEANHEIEKQNYQAQEELKYKKLELDKSMKEINDNNQRIKEINLELQELHNKYVESQKETSRLIEEYIQSQKQMAEEDIERAKENYKQQLIDIQKEATVEFITNQEEIKLEIALKTAELNALTAIVNSAIEANKRAEEMKLKQDFYRLQISNEDVAEIAVLRSVEPKLRNPEPLNKVIYKFYYENAYTALIGRVFGQKKKVSGIYKITNIENQMCYIGQSVDIAERWRQHIKKGIGADTPTKNKLYPALKSIGVENFTFEIIEECEPERLDEQEKFWISFYKAQEFGYNATKGG